MTEVPVIDPSRAPGERASWDRPRWAVCVWAELASARKIPRDMAMSPTKRTVHANAVASEEVPLREQDNIYAHRAQTARESSAARLRLAANVDLAECLCGGSRVRKCGRVVGAADACIGASGTRGAAVSSLAGAWSKLA